MEQYYWAINHASSLLVIHAVVDSKGRPLSFTVTGGQVHDSQAVEEILTTPRSPLAITADKGCDGDAPRFVELGGPSVAG
jgi:transposase